MISLLIILVCIFATLVGSICGMGGGIIIKPVLDACGIMDAATISFLSGCTVLAMSCYSVAEIKLSKKSQIRKGTGTPLAIGAAVGGIVGKQIFLSIKSSVSDLSKVGLVQAICMLLLTFFCLLYHCNKEKMHPVQINRKSLAAVVGLLLGIMSAFLGIGGGPVNVTILFLLFAMETKEAAQNSLYIILFCQLFSLAWTIMRGQVPDFPIWLLILMAVSGICGSVVGRLLNRRIASKSVDLLFRGLMVLIIAINLYNIVVFMQ